MIDGDDDCLHCRLYSLRIKLVFSRNLSNCTYFAVSLLFIDRETQEYKGIEISHLILQKKLFILQKKPMAIYVARNDKIYSIALVDRDETTWWQSAFKFVSWSRLSPRILFNVERCFWQVL